MDNHWEWEGGHEAHTGINLTREGLFVPFEMFPGVTVPIGVYDHTESQLTFNTNRGAPVSASIRSTIGGFFGGDRVRLVPRVSVRLAETLNAQLQWDWNNIDLPSGEFTTNLASLRVSYSFTTRLFLQALVQYNDRADLWSSNVRVRSAVRREHGPVHRLQRHPGAGHPRPASRHRPFGVRPHADAEIQPAVRPAQLNKLLDRAHGFGVTETGTTRTHYPGNRESHDRYDTRTRTAARRAASRSASARCCARRARPGRKRRARAAG